MTTRALIFDYGNVLDIVDDMQPWLAKRDMMAAPFGMSGEELWNLIYYTEPWQKLKRGQISVDEFWDAILRPLGITDHAAQMAFADRLVQGRDKVHPEMAALLRELKPHYRLALLSNTHLLDMDVWIADVQGLIDIFDVVVSSAAVGLAKPEPEIYQLALQRLSVEPEEALFIDDLPRNTTAAQALGIPSIVFVSPTQLRRELQERGILPVPQDRSR
jgi:epoxide hydrolase-like predicted phosphatase